MQGGGKDIAMRTLTTIRNTPNRAFLSAELGTPQPRPPHPPSRHRSFVQSKQSAPALRSEVAELMADVDGVPVLVRFLVTRLSADVHSDLLSGDADLHSLLSSMLAKMVDRMGGSSRRGNGSSKRALAAVESISSAENLAQLPALSNDTMLRVGPLQLDLLDRTAKRGDRWIDLRPREFQLLKYMMQRSDKLLTRAALLKDVWNYKFVPKTNLVDVHMGRLRRKIDGPNESPLISNVRGVGFVLSGTPFSQYSAPTRSERSTIWPSDTSVRSRAQEARPVVQQA
jgi:DNA-binding winged helix-turn-helix (wHTH) protein